MGFIFKNLIILLFMLATDLFSECYSNSEDRAYALLVRKTSCWNQTTVLNLATEADAKSFFAHDGVQVTAPIAYSIIYIHITLPATLPCHT